MGKFEKKKEKATRANKLNKRLAIAKGASTRAAQEHETEALEKEFGKAKARRMIDGAHLAGW
jgi:hypothetical protein